MKKLIAVMTLLVMVFALGCAKAPAEPVNIAALTRDSNASSTQGVSTGIRHDF